jgi:glycosyltransferase involved in cell wall biosynthesis
MAAQSGAVLNILHILRAPVGGLFRHVADLARGQTARGHRVGLVCDAASGGTPGQDLMAGLARELAYGISRQPMSRHIGWSDIAAVKHVARRAIECSAEVVHGHGAKGGAFARLAPVKNAIRVYTPHGGSLHYDWKSPAGFFYLAAERVLMSRTDLFLFESEYGRDTFRKKIGNSPARFAVVNNGVSAAEFAPVTPAPDATELLFIGELRRLKGVDVLIDALAALGRKGERASCTIVGDGPDRGEFEARARALALGAAIRFTGAMPAREAFSLGRVLVLPSRAESLPYIALEAAAAGLPIIATRVGGMAEIFGEDAGRLVPPGDPDSLARAIAQALTNSENRMALASRLQARVRRLFSVETMTDAVLAAYRETLHARNG